MLWLPRLKSIQNSSSFSSVGISNWQHSHNPFNTSTYTPMFIVSLGIFIISISLMWICLPTPTKTICICVSPDIHKSYHFKYWPHTCLDEPPDKGRNTLYSTGKTLLLRYVHLSSAVHKQYLEVLQNFRNRSCWKLVCIEIHTLFILWLLYITGESDRTKTKRSHSYSFSKWSHECVITVEYSSLER